MSALAFAFPWLLIGDRSLVPQKSPKNTYQEEGVMIHVVFQVLDLHLDEEAEAPWTFPTLVARILVKLQAVLEAVRPETLVVVQDGCESVLFTSRR